MNKRNIKKLHVVPYLIVAAGLLLALGAQPALSYPPAAGGGEYSGWTGESCFGSASRHVQMASNGSRLYFVWDAGNDVFFRYSDQGGFNVTSMVKMDYAAGNTACDAYIAASGNNVALSWKELVGSRWAIVVAFSTDGGATWNKYIDSNAGWNNYEAHLAYFGGSVHAVYTSDYPGWNECYYARWTPSGVMTVAPNCMSDSSDGVADLQPCLTTHNGSDIWAFYRHESRANAPVWEAYSNDGTSWGQEEKLADPNYDHAWPECTRMSNKNVAVISQAYDGSNYISYEVVWTEGIGWEGAIHTIFDSGPSPTYPQIAARGTELFVVTRDVSVGDTCGIYNPSAGANNAWSKVEHLFYGNMSYDHPGSMDVCTDGTRWYSVSAGTGDHGVIMVKREDLENPTATFHDPGRYYKANFAVTADAYDTDWNNPSSISWFLSPDSQPYQRGIVRGVFGYKLVSGTTWTNLEDTNEDGTWSATLPAATLPQGEYKLRFVVEDTSGKTTTAEYSGAVCVDRTAPNVATGVVTGGVKDAGTDWYRTPPTITASFSDALSGIDDSTREYKVNEGIWQVYTGPFVASEGDNDYFFRAADRCGNISSSSPAPLEVKVDTTEPGAEASLPPADGSDGWRICDAAATVTLSAADNGGGSGVAEIQYAWDGTPENTYSDPVVCPEGVHTIYYRARDRAGNWSDIGSEKVKKDTTPPAVSIVEPSGEQWIRGMATVKADASDNCKVGSVDFYMDGELFDHRESYPWMASLDTTAWNNDYHVISVVARDAAGNASMVGNRAELEVFVGNNISETNNFAEGCTRDGFDTWLCLQNPGDEDASVTINYMLGPGQGPAGARNYAVPSHSRMTILVNNDVGPDKDVSIQVSSSKPIVSERPMYFSYSGGSGLGWKGSHTAQGASVPREEWYLAEGCTRDGFEEWICIQNPGDVPADVGIDFMLGDGRVITRHYRLDSWQRFTVMVNEEVGPGQDVAAHIYSSAPIVAERPMYFLYQGMWDGGHNVMGAYQPEQCWYFAEGCTRQGFNQWLCIQNPNERSAKVKIDYMTEDGGMISKEYGIPAHSRYTVNVNNDVARQHDVSTRVVSDLPVIVERPMYFLYQMRLDEGSDAMGVNKACSSWYLAEGCTRAGFEEYVCLQNPGEREASVVLSFMLEDGSVLQHGVMVSPGFRVTVRVNDIVGEGHDVSTEVMSDEPIVCERPMYATYGGDIQAADTLAGYTFDK